MQTSVPLSEFELNASHYVHQTGKTGQELTITDHGNPVVKIIPVVTSATYTEDYEKMLEPFRGMVIRYDDPLEPTGEDWGY